MERIGLVFQNAEEFLLHYLPKNVVELLDLDSLEYTKDSFVDRHLKEYFSDLLFVTYFKDGSLGYVYILFEHKSYQERSIAFHMLRYMVKIWEKRDDPAFPVIIPQLMNGEKRECSKGFSKGSSRGFCRL